MAGMPGNRDMSMIGLRLITPGDVRDIKSWPPYGCGFEQMDYALRENGWLDEFRDRPGTWIYAALSEDGLIGFSLLSKTAEGEVEFRIALHPDRTGEGLGWQVTRLTLEQGFRRLGLRRISLIVRKNNPRALTLYERVGFTRTGESVHQIQGKEISFIDMDMTRERYDKARTGEGA